ncbi:MAG: 5-(carboxyamino)imidazole ribonucleotide synthase [Alphaproteobacteria bacterium]|nr:5-(carboxyamino)imidazole ribonucleotide synthase [Alphaproteobacteria bacterium]
MTHPLPPGSTIGIFGSGQLGRMLAMAAAELGLRTHIYSDASGPACDCAAAATILPYTDAEAIKAFAAAVDVITFEFENVPLDAVEIAGQHAPISPDLKALEIAQDRFVEKTFVANLAIPVAPFANIESEADLDAAGTQTGWPARLKTRRLGYDGKGQVQVSNSDELARTYADMGRPAAVLEGHINFSTEVSVLAVRDRNGHTAFYDLPENKHKDGILDTSRVPSQLPQDLIHQAHDIARRIADALDYIGLLAVELFVLPEGAAQCLLVNEIAPRVHNSGHWTSDACQVSQFENHIRAIAGWPLGATDRHSNAQMTNLIGTAANSWPTLATQSSTSVHLYGKREARPGRKMGHYTEISPISSAKTREK